MERIKVEGVRVMKIGFDFDDTLTTTKGMNIAKLRRSQGHELFIVSARNEVGVPR